MPKHLSEFWFDSPNFDWTQLKQVLNDTYEINEYLEYILGVFEAGNLPDGHRLQKLNGAIEHCLS